ncbi:histidine phosphatase family protein [Arhodomonas sp. AD133]|uniref:histidine phosphatase family protein n=1 Tax=Arhodomonas sp. AD133 TaxID=3415009 RepID=UPI003EC04679
MQRIDTGRARFVDFIRHGVPVGGRRYRGHRDDPLSEQGWHEMWAAVGDDPPSWSLIVTSPLRRCAEFATELGGCLDVPVITETGFKEISFGAWEGRTVDAILAESPEEISAYWHDPVANTPPRGESLPDFRDRVVAAWERLLERQARHVLVVGHGGLIRTLVGHVLGMPLPSVLRLEVPNAGITRLRVQSDVNGRPAPSLVFHARQGL